MASSPPRIAILTPKGISGHLGGVEMFNNQVKQALGDVEIFAYSEGQATNRPWNLWRIGAEQPYRALHVVRAFLERHRTRPFHLAMSNGLYGWPLSLRRLNIPMVQVYHFTMAGLARRALRIRGDKITTGTVSAFFDGLSGRGKKVVAVSHSVLREVERYYRLKGEIIPNGVDATLFRKLDKSQAREALGLPQEGEIGLFVGRPEYAKGFDIFLEVAKSLQNCTFVVVGGCSDVPPNVKVLGKIPHSQMPLCYSSADFFFLPSRYEGFNMSILEALACDLPIVTSEAAYPFLEDPSQYGRVVEGQRPEYYVEAIEDVLGRGSSYACREAIFGKYTLEIFLRDWDRLVRAMINGGGIGDS